MTEITELKQEIQQLKEDHKNEIQILHNEIKELKTENQKINLRLQDLERYEKVIRDTHYDELRDENKKPESKTRESYKRNNTR